MRLFNCTSCGWTARFESSHCARCLAPLGYLHDTHDVVALIRTGQDRMVDMGPPLRALQYCATRPMTGCNWLVPIDPGGGRLCPSCALTRTRPSDGDAAGLSELVAAEEAKRRLVFQLSELGLPIGRRDEAAGTGVAFDLLSSVEVKVITGHDDGIITLDLAEADDEHREHLRVQLSEPYRTLLGHFRHEIGHYYWPLVVTTPEAVDACRALFGDDRIDYREAVRAHYRNDADPGDSWSESFISRYATMHPFEDWAESFAHYLHILDTMQTAASFGLAPTGTGPRPPDGPGRSDPTRPDGSGSFGALVDRWLELSSGLNQINRSMGRDDLYPFTLAPPVIRKLAFIDRVVRSSGPRTGPDGPALEGRPSA